MLAEVLVQLGMIKAEKLASATARQQRTGEELDEVVLALQLVTERDMLRATARQFGHQYLTTEKVAALAIPSELTERLPVRLVESLATMPLRLNPDGTLWVLSAYPLSADALERLRTAAGARGVSQILARRVAILAAQRKHYYGDAGAFNALEERELLARMSPPPPVPARTGDLEVDITIAEPASAAEDDADGEGEADGGTTAPRVITALPEEVAALQRENDRLRTANSLASTVASVHQLDVLAHELLTAMLDLFPADGVAFALTGEQGAPLLLESRARAGEPGVPLQIDAGIVRAVVNGERPLLILDLQREDRFAREEAVVARKVRSLVSAPIRSRKQSYGALYAEAITASAFDGNDLEMLSLVGSVAGAAVENALSRQRLEDEVIVRHALRRFLPAELADRAPEGATPSLLPLRAEATVLVACLEDFAAFTRQGDPDEVMRRIDELNDLLLLPIFEHGGTVQGEVRGGIGAVFGPPRDSEEHEERAVAAAVELAKRAQRGDGTAGQQLSIGLATGEVVVGAVGPLSRLQFLAVGDPAEHALQLARRAQPGEILACHQVSSRVNRFLTWQPLAPEQGAEPRPAFRLQWR